MSNLTTLDDLHDDEETVEVQNIGEDSGIESPRAGSAEKEKEEEDPKESEEGTEESVEDELSNEEEGEESSSSGIDQFLAQHGIVGGMITFEGEDGEDPETKHFNELTAEEQFNILHDLTDNSGNEEQDISKILDEDEIGLLSWVREQGTSVEDAIDKLATERFEQLKNFEGGQRYEDMPSEAIVGKWLKDTNPEASDEDLIEELENLKNGKFFEKQADVLRNQFINEQKQEEERVHQARQEEAQREIDEDRVTIANAAKNIERVAGWDINEDMKNDVLETLLEVNEEGDSQFMAEVFGNPEKLFKAAWLYKFGESHFDQLETYFKKEITNQFQEGKRVGESGLSKEPLDGGYVPKVKKGKKDSIRQEKIVSLDDLHELD